MAQRESKLSRDIMAALRLQGAWCIKVHGSEFMQVGVPDIIGCYGGRFFAFETKTPDKRNNTSMVQNRIIQKIRDAGGLAQVVCTTTEAVDAMMQHRIKSRRPGNE
jgi:Holliday junction resolvase